MAKQHQGFRNAEKKKPGLNNRSWLILVLLPIILALIESDTIKEVIKMIWPEKPVSPTSIPDSIIQTYFTGENKVDYSKRSAGKCTCAKGYGEIYQGSFTIDSTKEQLSQFFKLRAEAYHKKIQEICQRYVPLELNLGYIQEVNNNSWQVHQENAIAGALESTFCSAYDSIRYDAVQRKYIARFGICYKSDEFFPVDLRNFVEDAIQKYDSFRDFQSNPRIHELNLGLLQQYLIEDIQFIQGYHEYLDKYKEQLKILQLDLGAKNGLYAVFFDSGKYQLSPVSLVIIHIAMRYYIQYIEDHPGQEFELCSIGFTDGMPISKNGISYDRNGAYSSSGEAIRIHNEGIKIERIPAGYQGNRELAYARAYEASVQLEQIIQNEYPNLLHTLQLTYRGDIAPASKMENPHERRVSIQLQEKTKNNE